MIKITKNSQRYSCWIFRTIFEMKNVQSCMFYQIFLRQAVNRTQLFHPKSY